LVFIYAYLSEVRLWTFNWLSGNPRGELFAVLSHVVPQGNCGGFVRLSREVEAVRGKIRAVRFSITS